MNKKFFFGIAVFVFVFTVFLGATWAKDAYVVGVGIAVTGPGSDSYAPIKEALDIYFKEVNDKGGINGHPVELVIEDNASQPSKAAAQAKKFVFQDKVVLSVLASLSSTYAPVVQVAQQQKVPLFFGGAVCPHAVYPPEPDAFQYCSTAFGAKYDSRFAVPFLKKQGKGNFKLGLMAMNIPVARGEIEYADGLAREMGLNVVDKEFTPPATADYVPFATKLKDAGSDWVYAWSPWGSQIRTFEALRKIGWKGKYLAYSHTPAEDELKRIKDDDLYVFGSNAFFADNTPMHQRIKSAAEKSKSIYPYTQMTEGWIAAMILEEILKNTSWPPTPEKIRTAMNNLNVDMQGLKGGPMIWTEKNHFRTVAYYRVYKWDSAKNGIVVVEDWTPIEAE